MAASPKDVVGYWRNAGPEGFALQSRVEDPKRRRPAGFPAGLHGGAKRSRTADLLNAIQALYQLSYSPEVSGPGSPGRRGTY